MSKLTWDQENPANYGGPLPSGQVLRDFLDKESPKMTNPLTPEELEALPEDVREMLARGGIATVYGGRVDLKRPELRRLCKLLAQRTLALREAERFIGNCRYWNVTPAQMDVAERLMKTKGKYWPAQALAIFQEMQEEFACCGEVFMAAAIEYAIGRDPANLGILGMRAARKKDIQKAREALKEGKSDGN